MQNTLGAKIAVGVTIIAACSLSGCNEKATQALQAESSQTSAEVLILKEQIKKLEDLLHQQANSQIHLLETSEETALKIRELDGNIEKLKSSDEKTESLFAVAGSDANKISSSVSDLYRFVQQLKNADQAEFDRMQQRQQKIEAASLPIKQRIAQLSAKRDQYLADIMASNASMERPARASKGPADDYNTAVAAFNTLPETLAVEKLINERIRRNQQAIQEIDIAIQNERAQLLDLRQSP